MALSLSSVLALPWPKKLTAEGLDMAEIEALKQRAIRVMEQLVTPEGIYASSALAWHGAYHAFFGRDTAITAGLIWETEQIGNKYWFSPRAISALLSLGNFQGQRNHPVTGEELGKIPHEMRTHWEDIRQLLDRQAEKRQKPWHVSPFDHYLKNWDSADSTPLWIIMVGRWAEVSGEILSKAQLGQVRRGLQWCLHNLEQYGGLIGFRAAELNDQRRYGGLLNQSWKDSHSAYLDSNGHLPPHPIYDVYVNGTVWAALSYGAQIFKSIDQRFTKKLSKAARQLRKRFNSPRRGFRFYDASSELWYCAEAIDGNGKQLQTVAADVGLLLWTYHRKRSVIYRQFLPDVAKRLLKPDLFNSQAGLRTYTSRLKHYQSHDTYHRGPATYWPFESGLIVAGLHHFGYTKPALKLAKALIKGLAQFDSCVELFVEKSPNRLTLWRSTSSPQTSSTDQAWSAAALYYATTYLQKYG